MKTATIALLILALGVSNYLWSAQYDKQCAESLKKAQLEVEDAKAETRKAQEQVVYLRAMLNQYAAAERDPEAAQEAARKQMEKLIEQCQLKPIRAASKVPQKTAASR
jgi:exonuclease VII small subunit